MPRIGSLIFIAGVLAGLWTAWEGLRHFLPEEDLAELRKAMRQCVEELSDYAHSD